MRSWIDLTELQVIGEPCIEPPGSVKCGFSVYKLPQPHDLYELFIPAFQLFFNSF